MTGLTTKRAPASRAHGRAKGAAPRELYDVGESPPLGHVPPLMHAQVVRRARFGAPRSAFVREVVETPRIGRDEVLVHVMAAGVNYNNVWAALGRPVDVIATRRAEDGGEDFHVGGSDGAGVVYAVGGDVADVRVGDEVVLHCGMYDAAAPGIARGGDATLDPSFRIWGYETSWGSFAQFTRVKAHQCLPKAPHLSWEAAAASTLVGATAYRMLFGFAEHRVGEGDVVLVWGGAGGLGSLAIQLAAARGARPIAVVSSDAKAAFCRRLGAIGCIDRRRFDHWGRLPRWDDAASMSTFTEGARAFGRAIWDVVGERRNPRVVIEHPGQDTIPTSMFVTAPGGMVVVCAGTTGYNADVDLRYLWMRQKRLQGSHFANGEQARAFNELVRQRVVDPCLSRVFAFDELAECHQLMHDNRHPDGNMAVLVGAPSAGSRSFAARAR